MNPQINPGKQVERMDKDQKDYWNKVANQKVFTHPLNMALFKRFVNESATILDFGCGYGRMVELLNHNGYSNVCGFDTSIELVNRGKRNGVKGLFHIDSPIDLPLKDDSIDSILLFAVLTCLPDNLHQLELIETLTLKLKRGGIIYISDYYLQDRSTEMERYENYNGDEDNFGVFTLPEGVTLRHHTKQWIMLLLKNLKILSEDLINVKTMNGNSAQAFQIIAKKT